MIQYSLLPIENWINYLRFKNESFANCVQFWKIFKDIVENET